MKTQFTIFFLLFLTLTHSQDLKSVEIFAPESTDYTDLSFLKEEIQEKRVFLLGEQLIMFGNVLEMKVRFIEYLHQELGFSTIALDSSMYDIWKNNLNKTSSDIWAHTSEIQRLANYIEKHKLKVITLDAQDVNNAQIVDDFLNYCESQKMNLKLDSDDVGIVMESVLEHAVFDEEEISFKDFEKELLNILTQIEKLQTNETHEHWGKFIKNLLTLSKDAYHKRVEFCTINFDDETDQVKAKKKVNNLLRYYHGNPNEKIIIWADQLSNGNDKSIIQKPVSVSFFPLNVQLKKAFTESIYRLAVVHANDSLMDLTSNQSQLTPLKVNSFEYELNRLNKPFLFVTSNQQAMLTVKESRLLNGVDFMAIELNQFHEGYVFIQNGTIPKIEITNTSVVNKPLDSILKVEPIESGQNLILKGQILDYESNKPISFATLVLKTKGIYRVADEQGYYEIPIKKTYLNTEIVEVSSLGFESKSLMLNDLKDKIYLKPKYETLKEVVVIGYLTPLKVLKKAIANKKKNHPIEPFNFHRYSKILVNKNDINEVDLELITKDYDQGYLSPYIITQRVEQIKWNTNKYPKKYQYSSQFFAFRQNAIQYANILHKRKYKKFKLSFIKSNDASDDGLYIIAFQTERDKWSYTNRAYPTVYSGRVYVNKENFAVVKVVENWETTLSKEETEKHFEGQQKNQNTKLTTIKEKNICTYLDIFNNGKYYALQYFNRTFNERITNENKEDIHLIEIDSDLYDFETKNVEKIEFEYQKMEQTVLNRVKFDQYFWDLFYQKDLRRNY